MNILNTVGYRCGLKCEHPSGDHELTSGDKDNHYTCTRCGLNVFVGDADDYAKAVNEPKYKGETFELGEFQGERVVDKVRI